MVNEKGITGNFVLLEGNKYHNKFIAKYQGTDPRRNKEGKIVYKLLAYVGNTQEIATKLKTLRNC